MGVLTHAAFFMKLKNIFSISVCTFLLLQGVTARAGWFGADFNARLIHGSKQGNTINGSMYVDSGRVRTEIEQDGQLSIEIIDPFVGKAWVLDQDKKQYTVRDVPVLSKETANSHNPCSSLAGAECRLLATEILNGRQAKKWFIQTDKSKKLQWRDVQHGFPVQVVESGQVVMSMVYLGSEVVNDRKVERWKALQRRQGSIIESQQWYDPQLNIAIRQLAQDGSYRQLNNIKIGKQNEALFLPPQGYKKQDAMTQ